MKNVKEMVEYPSEGILSKTIVKTENLDVGLFCMVAGSEISEHTASKEAVVYVVEGEGVFCLKGEEIEMREGTVIHMMPDEKHWLKAKEDTSFMLTLFS